MTRRLKPALRIAERNERVLRQLDLAAALQVSERGHGFSAGSMGEWLRLNRLVKLFLTFWVK